MTTKRTPADVLRESRQRDSLAKRARVLAVLDDLKTKGEPITFLGIAKAAGVSNWLVYAEGMREHIEAARKNQAGTEARERKSGATASAASLTTDLALARTELRALRDDRNASKTRFNGDSGNKSPRPATPNSSPGSTNSPQPTRSSPANSPALKQTETACRSHSPRPRTT